MKENYLAKWLNNELSEAELADFKKSPEYATYKRILDAADAARGPEYDLEKAFQEVQARKKSGDTRVITMTPWKKIIGIAAAVTLLVSLSILYVNTLDETVTTAYAQRTEVVLPDASEILLNAGSKISYDKRNWERERLVSLWGEAFFKVAKGQKFTVSTPAGEVSVLGTQFNVEQRDGYFEVSCYEGLVAVTYQGSSRELPAGHSFLVIDGRIVESGRVGEDVPSWMNDESSFRSTPLAYVLEEFERQYNIKVETSNVDLGQLYTGTFSNTNIDLALQSISTPFQISFKLEGNKVLFYAGDTP